MDERVVACTVVVSRNRCIHRYVICAYLVQVEVKKAMQNAKAKKRKREGITALMPGSVHAVEPVLDKANKAKILIYIQSWFDIQLTSLYRNTLKQHLQVKNKTPSCIKIGRCWEKK